jgi:hypothetical protein
VNLPEVPKLSPSGENISEGDFSHVVKQANDIGKNL